MADGPCIVTTISELEVRRHQQRPRPLRLHIDRLSFFILSRAKMWYPTVFTQLLVAGSAVSAYSIGSQRPFVGDSESASRTSLLSLHKSLVEIPSISRDEHNASQWLMGYLENQGFTVEAHPVSSDPPRENIFAYLGSTRKTRTLISSHIDTVPPFWPYERRGDEIWGRGSVDAKAAVATQIKAVEALIASKEIAEGDVAMLFVVGEEVSGDGMLAVNDWGMSWDTVIFGEPTELKLATGHKGIVTFRVEAHGKAGHSGYPELGRSANDMLIPALAKLMQIDLPWSERFGNTTCNIGRVEGGVAQNVIAEEAYALVAVRIADGDAEELEQIIRKALTGVTPDLEFAFGAGYGPVPIDHDVEGKWGWSAYSEALLTDLSGFETIVVNYGTDIAHLNGDHKRYLYGPGSILLAHSDHEHISISDLEEAVEGYKTLLLASLK